MKNNLRYLFQKKNVLIILIIILIVVIAIISIITYNKSKNTSDYKTIAYNYWNCENQIIYDYNDYLSFVSDYTSKYGDDNLASDFNFNKYKKKYFKKKSLAIINIRIGSSSNKLRGIDISFNGNELICKPNIKYAIDTINDDLICDIILVEIDKSVNTIVLK